MPNNQFDVLTPEQQEFLISYTKHRGELAAVIKELSIPGTYDFEREYKRHLTE